MASVAPPDPDAELSFDPDLGPDDEAHGVQLHRRYTWKHFVMVFVGGAVGTALRESVGIAVPSTGSIPVAKIAINIAGAIALGAALEALTRRGPESRVHRTLHLTFGTGLLGGFTTYSAIALDTTVLMREGLVGTAALSALGTVVVGAVAAWAGLAAAAASRRRAARGSV